MPQPVVFHIRSPFCLIEIANDAAAKIWSHRQISQTAPEAGGVLLGARRGPHLEIVEVTTPQNADSRTRSSFTRTERAHRRLARRRWENSARRHGYLGEWHTHPESSPTPSLTDRLGWRALSKQIHHPLVHLILGVVEARLWYCDENGIHQEAKLLP